MQQISEKVLDETTVNGSVDTQHNLKTEDKTIHDPTQTQSTAKAGTSPPTEHKQHLHLPLRKRHLLASSTGSHHNENSGDSIHTIPTQITGHAHDADTASTSSTTNIHIEPEPHQANMTTTKPIDPTFTEHPEHPEPPDPPEPPETNNNTAKPPLIEHHPYSALKVFVRYTTVHT
jgi:hypothetical protein